MLDGVSVPAATLLLGDLLERGPQMVANVSLVDRGNGAAALPCISGSSQP
jgi:hypothetical protein